MTNAVIRVKGDKKPNRGMFLFRDCQSVDTVARTVWKPRKRHVVKEKEPPVVESPVEQGQATVTTGCEVRRPARFMAIARSGYL